MGDMPLMTSNRHLHRQRHRAASSSRRCTVRRASFFDHDKGKSHSSGKLVVCCPRSFHIAAPGLDIEFGIPRTSSTPVSIAAARFRRPRC